MINIDKVRLTEKVYSKCVDMGGSTMGRGFLTELIRLTGSRSKEALRWRGGSNGPFGVGTEKDL